MIAKKNYEPDLATIKPVSTTFLIIILKRFGLAVLLKKFNSYDTGKKIKKVVRLGGYNRLSNKTNQVLELLLITGPRGLTKISDVHYK